MYLLVLCSFLLHSNAAFPDGSVRSPISIPYPILLPLPYLFPTFLPQGPGCCRNIFRSLMPKFTLILEKHIDVQAYHQYFERVFIWSHIFFFFFFLLSNNFTYTVVLVFHHAYGPSCRHGVKPPTLTRLSLCSSSCADS